MLLLKTLPPFSVSLRIKFQVLNHPLSYPSVNFSVKPSLNILIQITTSSHSALTCFFLHSIYTIWYIHIHIIFYLFIFSWPPSIHLHKHKLHEGKVLCLFSLLYLQRLEPYAIQSKSSNICWTNLFIYIYAFWVLISLRATERGKGCLV